MIIYDKNVDLYWDQKFPSQWEIEVPHDIMGYFEPEKPYEVRKVVLDVVNDVPNPVIDETLVYICFKVDLDDDIIHFMHPKLWDEYMKLKRI